MHKTNLRKVGGSIMLAVPPALLEIMRLGVGSTVGVSVESGRIIVEAESRPRYTLGELLAASDYAETRSSEDQQWIDAPPVGRELL